MSLEDRLQAQLNQRKAEGAFRTLTLPEGKFDFYSNDYLGFARSPELHQAILDEIQRLPAPNVGSTGSRLLSGNSDYLEKLEVRLAKFHQAEAGLLFNSGYDLNVGLLSALPQRQDTVLYDQFVHASIRDGLRMGHAKSFGFRHNDVEHLRQKMKQAQGQVFIAVESVYSMDGDFAPLEDLVSFCEETGAVLIVDEAHGTGVFGAQGRGRVSELGLESKVFARVHTFGKALGTHGALVVGSAVLRNYLINYARPFIYSTALPVHSLVSIQCAYDLLERSPDCLEALRQRIRFFKSKLPPLSGTSFLDSSSAIQGVVIPGNEHVKAAATQLQQEGFNLRPILSPTVPKGKERIRICLHVHNTPEEIQGLLESIQKVLAIS